MLIDIAVKAVELQVKAKLRAEHFYNLQAVKKKDKTIFIIFTGYCNIVPTIKCVLKYSIYVKL